MRPLAGPVGAYHPLRRRPHHAFVFRARKDDPVVARSFVATLRPDRHQGAIRAVKHEEVLVARVKGRAIHALRPVDNIIGLCPLDFAVEDSLGRLRPPVAPRLPLLCHLFPLLFPPRLGGHRTAPRR